MEDEKIKSPLSKSDVLSELKMKAWRKDVFAFCDEMLNMRPAEPIDELKGKVIKYTSPTGQKREVVLFDIDGRLVYHDLSFYKIGMFKYQSKAEFKKHCVNQFTWQQTLELEAYNRGINTFDKDSYNPRDRRITIRSGHGIGKTSFASVICIHFLFCFYYAQIGATANTDTQLKEIFLKEFYWWKKRLPENVQDQLEEQSDKIKIKGTKNWFLRARVAGRDNPEALAGLHGEYVLLFPDEASGIFNKVFEVMQGALTGENWLVIMTSNPTRTEGYFYDSHKPMNIPHWVQLQFDSRESPIVKDTFVQGIINDYGENSDEFRVRVEGNFPSAGEMDDQGWIPLFANMNILFEPAGQQIINGGVIGVDPAGQGRDRSIIEIRDNVYLKELLNEATSSEPDLARKIETLVSAYNCSLNDVGVDAFGLGAKVINHIQTKMGEMPNALLCDKPREEVKDKYNSYKAELAWKFRQWVANGGIIVTNNQKDWLRELDLIKYKRDLAGRICLMPKTMFKKEYGFSPDRFDACCYTFFRDEPSRPVILSKHEMENREWASYIDKVNTNEGKKMSDFSTM